MFHLRSEENPMKNSFIIKNIRRALLKQLIFPVLLLLVSLTVFLKTPKDNIFNPRPLNFKSSFENFYNRDLPHVTVSVPNLRYSGLDYVVDGHIQGHYYYTLIDGRCQFYVLAKEAGTPPAAVRSQMNLRGRLIELDDIEYKAILKDMAERLDWTVPSLGEISSPYAISTVPYPVYLNILFFTVLYGCLLLSALDILYSAIYIMEPLRSPTFRYLGTFGEIRTLLPKVEMEMKHISMAKAGNIYLTPNYIVNVDTVRSLILPLNSVSWVYYRSHIRRFPFTRILLTYTLHIVAEDGRTYDFTKKKKEDLDCILEKMKEKKLEVLLGYSKRRANHSPGS